MNLRGRFVNYMPYERYVVYRQLKVVFRWYKADFEVGWNHVYNVDVCTSRFNRTTLTYEHKHIHTYAWRY